jgi:hypothetical protein
MLSLLKIRLIIDTAKTLPKAPRLASVCLTWLTHYGPLVCRHRLTRFASDIASKDTSAGLGLMLTMAKEHTSTDHFNLAIKVCKPTDIPKPLFTSDQGSEQLSLLVKNRSCNLGRQWGLWCEDVALKEDAVRPLSWVMDRNPSLKYRALFGGNLRASILETLRYCPDAGQSESALARECYATRKAIRQALDHLEFCQLVSRIHDAARVRIILNDSQLKHSA